MPLERQTRSAFSSFIDRHFGSAKVRFRSAVTLGFFMSALGFLTTGPGAHAIFADEMVWGSFADLFNQPHERTIANPQPQVGRQADRVPALRRIAHRRPVREASHDPVFREFGGQSLCVRLCDGYVFPVGTYHGGGDNPSHQAACQATCPDAATALYVMPPGADTIDKAVQVGTNRPYSKLPDAFHYTTVLDDACTCHRSKTSHGTLSLLRDFTLRRGDAIMTGKGMKVFHGGGHFPFRRDDFVALARSGDVRKADRVTFGAMERASLIRPSDPRSASEPTVAEPAAGPGRVARARLQHQANRE